MADAEDGDRRPRLRTSLDEGSINAYSQFKAIHIAQYSRVCTCKDARGRDVVMKAYSVAKLSDLEVKQARLQLRDRELDKNAPINASINAYLVILRVRL